MSDQDIALLRSVHAAEPDAAAPLYDRFASGVRAILRHKLPDSDLEAGVFHVLVSVARAVRQGGIQNPDLLPAEVRAVTNAYIGNAAIDGGPPVEQLRSGLEQLDPQEREILARFYRLGQSEEQIGREMKFPVAKISMLRRNVRRQFLGRRKH